MQCYNRQHWKPDAGSLYWDRIKTPCRDTTKHEHMNHSDCKLDGGLIYWLYSCAGIRIFLWFFIFDPIKYKFFRFIFYLPGSKWFKCTYIYLHDNYIKQQSYIRNLKADCWKTLNATKLQIQTTRKRWHCTKKLYSSFILDFGNSSSWQTQSADDGNVTSLCLRSRMNSPSQLLSQHRQEVLNVKWCQLG